MKNFAALTDKLANSSSFTVASEVPPAAVSHRSWPTRLPAHVNTMMQQHTVPSQHYISDPHACAGGRQCSTDTPNHDGRSLYAALQAAAVGQAWPRAPVERLHTGSTALHCWSRMMIHLPMSRHWVMHHCARKGPDTALCIAASRQQHCWTDCHAMLVK